ncbi:MAG: CDP-diglyceride synthetase [Actinomycetia bacterium]|nr:CDP-diglyceride synthetase [Actinomycetes bacterium]
MSDHFDDGPKPSPTEGVRILGAEEAQAAVESGAARPTGEPDPETPAENGDKQVEPATRRDEAPRAEPPPAAPTRRDPPPAGVHLGEVSPRPVRFPDDGPSWSAADVEADAPETPTGEVPALPHWTEPATGAVPAIFADDEAPSADPDLDAWASLSGSQPRFRADNADWEKADFGEGDLTDDSVRIGAMADAPPDDEADFAEALAQRRPRRPSVRARRGANAAAVPSKSPSPGTPRRPPANYASEPAQSSSSAGRDLPTALATAAILAALALLCFKLGTAATSVLAAVVVAACTLEFCHGLQERGFRPATLLATLGAGGLVLAARNFGVGAYPVVFGLVVVFSFLWFLLEVTPGRPTLGIATTMLAFGYVGGLGAFAGLLLQPDPNGVGLLLGVAICVIASDAVGFFVGSQFGKTPIAPRISPHKSVQGTIGGMLASLVAGWAIVGLIHPWTHSRGLALGALVALGALLGDLSESMLKRDLGIKDFGSVLPGHGGVLDRFDALLFCLPITYYLALHFKIV